MEQLDSTSKVDTDGHPTGIQPFRTANKVRFVTAASLFDGHDASINIVRRLLQDSGAEVIHLGHNRSVEEIVTAALQEDVQGIAVSSYQGGHMEFFSFMVDLLRERGGENIKVFGGGGGVIVPDEIRELEEHGVARIYSPGDGQNMGLQGIINDMLSRCDEDLSVFAPRDLKQLETGDHRALARVITALENGAYPEQLRKELLQRSGAAQVPVLGVTGTGGAGKSSLIDELILRMRLDQGEMLRIALLSADPTRRRTGGALLGDRIRMNAIDHPHIYMRSFATRDTGTGIPEALHEVIAACRLSGFDLVIVETPGMGQGDIGIVSLVDLSLYVMTPDFGAASQLEKIDMLDFADFIAINKFERRGAQDALRDVRLQVRRNRKASRQKPEDMPVFGTVASHFNDDGITALCQAVLQGLMEHGLKAAPGRLPKVQVKEPSGYGVVVPPQRVQYLGEIAGTLRDYLRRGLEQSRIARERQQLRCVKVMLEEEGKDASDVGELMSDKEFRLDSRSRELLGTWRELSRAYGKDEHVIKVRDKEGITSLNYVSLSGTKIPKVSLPRFEDEGEILRWLMRENLPGSFPFTAGVFPFKRENEEATRMFAGEGDAFRTNRRFKRLAEDMLAKRLSTAFDSVTLYGFDPDERPDIYGKIGNAGVSIATLEDMQVLYSGFDLCDPDTSVSMTINGPAPMVLAMFFNTAIDQQIEKFKVRNGRGPTEKESLKIRELVLSTVRGTVQADILKEDQAQNTCIFSIEFAIKMMGDIQEYFVRNNVQNFYSASISGYHIAEAGANPISQLAFTLANGFTYVEAYLGRGMHVDDFAPNLSFFFSNGMDPEYSVIGRVARRIWAVAMKERYGANERSQKLKYHIQTSGRSLHAQDMAFNDIRTTLQALIAIYDNCNSLHTNAYDEAITTPTEESVRRALAIQLIINKEWGLAKNENPNQGSFIIEELTDLVEEAVLREFEAISSRGGVLGAMETAYQRGKIQEESMLYESRKHERSYPIVGVNIFRNLRVEAVTQPPELARSTGEEKRSQLQRLRDFQSRHAGEAPVELDKLKQAVINNENVFEVLMDTVRCCSLGQITQALFEVGGRYRRSM